MIVFDTDVIVTVIGPDPPMWLIRRIAEIDPDQQATTSITVGELVLAALSTERPGQMAAPLGSRLWPNLRVLSFDRAAGERYGRLAVELERHGVEMPDAALRIAAICLDRRAVLATGLGPAFHCVPGLAVEDWGRP